MDMWKYFGITHTDHTLMNPMSLAKTQELVDRLCLPDNGRVLDVACGKAEFLCLVAERYEVAATGLDLSPITIEAARANVAARGLSGRIELLHMDGGKYEPDRRATLDLASCIGASWIYEGHKGSCRTLCGSSSRRPRRGAAVADLEREARRLPTMGAGLPWLGHVSVPDAKSYLTLASEPQPGSGIDALPPEGSEKGSEYAR